MRLCDWIAPRRPETGKSVRHNSPMLDDHAQEVHHGDPWIDVAVQDVSRLATEHGSHAPDLPVKRDATTAWN
jgi:hypothetical protein